MYIPDILNKLLIGYDIIEAFHAFNERLQD